MYTRYRNVGIRYRKVGTRYRKVGTRFRKVDNNAACFLLFSTERLVKRKAAQEKAQGSYSQWPYCIELYVAKFCLYRQK